MLKRQHQLEFLPVEPARLLDFVWIDRYSVGYRFGVASDHQRRGKRPRLRCKISHPGAKQSNLLVYLATHRLLDRFPRLGETGETRPHSFRKSGRAAQYATFALDR